MERCRNYDLFIIAGAGFTRHFIIINSQKSTILLSLLFATPVISQVTPVDLSAT